MCRSDRDLTKQPRPAKLSTSNHEILIAFREPGCPLCRVDALSEERLLSAFIRDGMLNPESRYWFVAAGGFCRAHAWGLHAAARSEGSGAPIADIYGQLARRDLERLTQLVHTRAGRGGRHELTSGLMRKRDCPICTALADSAAAHAAFLSELLDDEAGRSAYADSDGVCAIHLEQVLGQSILRHRDGDQARWLLADWRARLSGLYAALREYDRKRSFTAAAEPKGAEQGSWTEVIRRYVGEAGPSSGRLASDSNANGGRSRGSSP